MSFLPYFGPMPEGEYHADAKLDRAALSHSLIHALISRSPRHAWTQCRKLNPAYVPEESNEFDRGSAAHAILLEGEEKVCVLPFDDYRKKEAREARDAARAEGRIPIKQAAYDSVRRMVDIAREAILRCPDLSGVNLGAGSAEHAMIWQEGEGTEAIFCRARPDFIATARDVMLDYKTTGCAHPAAWMRTMLATGADLQEAFYRRGNAATGGPDARDQAFIFIVQESEPPYACAPVALAPAFKAFAEEKCERGIELWRASMKSGQWSAYPNRIAYLEPPAWAISAYMEGHEVEHVEQPDDNGPFVHDRIAEQA